jgi:hypothetical protein
MGRRRRDGNHSPQKNNSIQDSEINEENRYPVPDPKETMTNDTNEHSYNHKNTLKEEITENFMEKILDMVNQNEQDVLKEFPDTKNKEHEKTQETNK